MKPRVLYGLMLAVAAGLVACNDDPPTAPTTTTATAATHTASTSSGVTTTGGVQQDDPSGLLSGTASAVKPPPAPISALASADGQADGQDLAIALGAEQDMDVYATAFDKGNGIVAQGGGNIVAQGGGNYRLMEDTTASGAVTAKATATPAPAASGDKSVVITTTATPSPTAKPKPSPTATAAVDPDQLPIAKFKPALDAIANPATASQLVAREAVLDARLAVKAKKLPEVSQLAKAAKAALWQSNGDGTLIKTVSADVDRTVASATVTRHVDFTATVQDASNLMVHRLVHFSSTFADGSLRVMDREVVMLADGSQHIEFTQTSVGPLGGRRVVKWTKTLDLDGNVTGSGTLTAYGPKGKLLASVTLSATGTPDAPLVTATDPNTKLTIKVSLDGTGAPTAQLRDAGGATATPVLSTDAAPSDALGQAEEDGTATGAAKS